MQPLNSRLLAHGAVAGLISGAIVMAWFFVVDVVAGQPLATPVLLAGVLLDRQIVHATFGVLAGYTILHYGIFLALGAAAAVALRLIGVTPGLRHGLVFGVGVLNAVHYGALLVTDGQMLTALPAGHVLLANGLGGMGLAAYLHYAIGAGEPLGLGGLQRYRNLSQGIATGLVGAATVAVWFLVVDIVMGRPFFTPAALGSAVFLGASSPEEVQTTVGVIGSYTVLHLAAFCGVGFVLVWVSERIEETPGLWMLALMGFIIVEAGFMGVAGLLGGWVSGTLGWITVAVGNVLAVGTMGRWIWITHPGLKKRLVEQPVTTMV
ncbi:MAG: hypothetical protein O7I93_17200 [Gemmatimonadetes bacterium]|nr:hypothetical protein [Gemmatimonadota bacterium]